MAFDTTYAGASMPPSMPKEVPPHVQFEVRPVEDRSASVEAGRIVYKDIIFAVITPAGSKDRVERIAEEWLTHIVEETRLGRFPSSWTDHYKRAFAAFKEGLDIPEQGSPLAMWPVITPGQLRMLQDIGIRTVEQLASSNEEAIRHMGMGGRQLRQRAIDYLAQSADPGKVSGELETLRRDNLELKAQLEKQNKMLEQLAKKLEAQQAAQQDKAPAEVGLPGIQPSDILPEPAVGSVVPPTKPKK